MRRGKITSPRSRQSRPQQPSKCVNVSRTIGSVWNAAGRPGGRSPSSGSTVIVPEMPSGLIGPSSVRACMGGPWKSHCSSYSPRAVNLLGRDVTELERPRLDRIGSPFRVLGDPLEHEVVLALLAERERDANPARIGGVALTPQLEEALALVLDPSVGADVVAAPPGPGRGGRPVNPPARPSPPSS